MNQPSQPSRPGQPVAPIPQGPPGHGQSHAAVSNPSSKWVLRAPTDLQLPEFGSTVKAVPYKVETREGRKSGVPYHIIWFRIIEGPSKEFDRLTFRLSEAPSVEWLAHIFFGAAGYPFSAWKPEHHADAKGALEHVVKRARPMLIKIGMQEAEDGNRYRTVESVSAVSER